MSAPRCPHCGEVGHCPAALAALARLPQMEARIAEFEATLRRARREAQEMYDIGSWERHRDGERWLQLLAPTPLTDEQIREGAEDKP